MGHKLIHTIKVLCTRATSAVLLQGAVGEWLRTSVGVRQGCLLSPTLFNIFLERIMTAALRDHSGTVSIGGWTITSLMFADDIDGLAGKEEELASLVKQLNTASSRYGMKISAEKTKLMTNSAQPITTKITVSGKELETADHFKYLETIKSEEGSRIEILARAAQTATAMERLKIIWRDRNIPPGTKVKLQISCMHARHGH